jgi:hypothetical protein
VCLKGDPAGGCGGTSALPTGLSCAENAQCELTIYPCPTWQADDGNDVNDGYICTCIGSEWACVDCDQGGGICLEAGPPVPGSD